jgi:hypothetical protein
MLFAAAVALLWIRLADLDLHTAEALSAGALLLLTSLPVGYLATRSIGTQLWPLRTERLALAVLVGHPLAAAGYFIACLAGVERAFPLVMAAVSVLALLAWRSRASPPVQVAAEQPHLGDAVLAVVAAAIVFMTTRGYRALTPVEGGLLYDHSLEHGVHLAFIWELLRGVPPEQLPMAAGLAMPHYHVLGYLPAVLLVRYAGLGPVTAYHATLPVWHTGLLVAGIHLIVRARSESFRTALAANLAVFGVLGVAESVLRPETFAGRSPLEFFTRTPSGGGGILVWAAVAALLAAWQPRGSRAPLLLSALLVGISYGFKAQMFLMFGLAHGLWLSSVALGGRVRDAIVAGLLVVVAALPLALWWRPAGRLGHLRWEPGLFAREMGVVSWLEPLGLGDAWWLATPLAMLLLLRFSPLLPALTASTVARWSRAPQLDRLAGLALLVGLALACFLAADEIEPGETSALVVREALFLLQVLGPAAEILILRAVLSRYVPVDRWLLPSVVALTFVLLPVAWRYPVHRAPGDREPRLRAHPRIIISDAEQGALRYLRERTPRDSVVAQARNLALEGPDGPSGGLDRVPLIAGLAGRRPVLEYYRPSIDPAVDRQKALKRLFRTSDRSEGEAILDRFDVDYVLEHAPLRLSFGSPRLVPVYSASGVRVLWVTRGSTRPSEPINVPAGLR